MGGGQEPARGWRSPFRKKQPPAHSLEEGESRAKEWEPGNASVVCVGKVRLQDGAGAQSAGNRE